MSSRVAPQDHEEVVIPPRPRLTAKQRIEVLLQSKSRCAQCGERIETGQPWIADHRNARAISGDDSLANFQAQHVDCDKPKTAKDKALIAKVKRVKAKFETPKSEWPQTQKIRSAGFRKRQWENP